MEYPCPCRKPLFQLQQIADSIKRIINGRDCGRGSLAKEYATVNDYFTSTCACSNVSQGEETMRDNVSDIEILLEMEGAESHPNTQTAMARKRLSDTVVSKYRSQQRYSTLARASSSAFTPNMSQNNGRRLEPSQSEIEAGAIDDSYASTWDNSSVSRVPQSITFNTVSFMTAGSELLLEETCLESRRSDSDTEMSLSNAFERFGLDDTSESAISDSIGAQETSLEHLPETDLSSLHSGRSEGNRRESGILNLCGRTGRFGELSTNVGNQMETGMGRVSQSGTFDEGSLEDSFWQLAPLASSTKIEILLPDFEEPD